MAHARFHERGELGIGMPGAAGRGCSCVREAHQQLRAVRSCAAGRATFEIAASGVEGDVVLGPLLGLAAKTLRILHGRAITDMSGLEQCSSLHALDHDCCGIADVSGLGQCDSLHSLYLSSRSIAGVSQVGKCGSLHTLGLFGCTDVSDVSGLEQCGSLHTLDLSKCTGITDVGAGAIAAPSTPHPHGMHKHRRRFTRFQGWGSSLHTLGL
eukprot:TRINITY_DN829_c0_g2_i1.p1 TRINITY_DN829_c0_g2~~TRINITY_DN829_c0_g2_i1.p1  ORF type:complete len:211 (+),score=29.89 TRINITY_DN829_c0_g2_i1:180-812(+)